MTGYTRPLPEGDLNASRVEHVRALTHPLRLRLLDLFRPDVELTATQCAQVTGESVASCSFHLRQLEKYGYVERVGTRGKERPWRTVARTWSVRPDLDDPRSVAATKAFAGLWLHERLAGVQQWLSQIDQEDPVWLSAATATGHQFWATRDELDEVSRLLERIADQFLERDDPARRPPGARRVHVLGVAWAELPATSEEQR
ncbi:MAG TPA: helix-turn-helix domain-containing protein [Micromonosporaceae bacterium]|jgi:hypothetical protein